MSLSKLAYCTGIAAREGVEDDEYSDAEGGGSPTRSPGGPSKGMGSNGLLLRMIKVFIRVSEDVPQGQFFAKVRSEVRHVRCSIVQHAGFNTATQR